MIVLERAPRFAAATTVDDDPHVSLAGAHRLEERVTSGGDQLDRYVKAGVTQLLFQDGTHWA